ncbi:MAG: hypothetical protein HGA31_03995 [Candidatus Moranbacteria bacterium]|nr:hypothetical protein [Candidatus Moranbacteria bacterium]
MTGSHRKTKVGVDLDDVLLDLSTALCAFHNARHGTDLVRDDYTDYDLRKMWGCTRTEVIDRIEAFYDSPEHEEALPIHGAYEVLESLAGTHEFIIVTAKPERLRDMTDRWIGLHFPGIFESIHFVGNYHLHPEIQTRKRDICVTLDIGTFIDDALSNARDLAPALDRVFLLDSPWNREEVGYPSVTRVFSWDDIRVKLR